mmetsp:Transcript_80614/g.250172  ORF Transcript_80614/g.250172 Transcript_80614/m.250172 type:complete len:284 (+) Transcript_80614:888-1739(+)
MPRLRPLAVREWVHQGRAVREGRGDGPDGFDAPEERCVEDHLAEAHVARQPGETLADGGGNVPGVVAGAPLRRVRGPRRLLHGTRGLEGRHGLVDARLGRRIQRLGEARGLEAGAEDLEHELHEGAPQDLRRGHLLEPQVEAVARDEVEGEALAHSASTPTALQDLRTGDKLLLERRGVGGLMVPLALHLATVHNEDHVGDGDPGLRNVRAQHDLPNAAARPLERLRVLVAAEDAVQREDQALGGVPEDRRPRQPLAHLRDLHEARQEDQHGALLAGHGGELR